MPNYSKREYHSIRKIIPAKTISKTLLIYFTQCKGYSSYFYTFFAPLSCGTPSQNTHLMYNLVCMIIMLADEGKTVFQRGDLMIRFLDNGYSWIQALYVAVLRPCILS
jgi:hypothetical protein